MPTAQASIAAAALAAVAAIASVPGGWLFAAAIALILAVFTLGAIRSAAAPSARPAAWLALVASLGATGWVTFTERPDLTPLVTLLGPTLVVAIIVQLMRRRGRDRLTASLSLVVSACVLAMVAVTWTPLRFAPEGAHSVGLALLGVGVVSLAELLPISRALRRVLGVIGASVGGALIVMLVDDVAAAVPAVSGVVVAAFAGLMAAAAHAIVDRLAEDLAVARVQPARASVPGVTVPGRTPPGGEAEPAETSEPAATGVPLAAPAVGSLLPLRMTLPFVAVAPAAYVLGRIFVG